MHEINEIKSIIKKDCDVNWKRKYIDISKNFVVLQWKMMVH